MKLSKTNYGKVFIREQFIFSVNFFFNSKINFNNNNYYYLNEFLINFFLVYNCNL